MYKRFFKLFLLSIILGNITILKAEEVNLKKASSVFVFQDINELDKKHLKVKYLLLKEDYGAALKEALESLRLSEQQNNLTYKIKFSYLIGDIFINTHAYKDALKYYKRSFFLQKKRNVFWVNNALKVGATYQRLNKKDSAIAYYNKVTSVTLKDEEYQKIKSKTYNNLSGLYLKDSNYFEAKKYSLKSIEIIKKTGDFNYLSAAYANLANIYTENSNYSKAKEYYLKAIELIKEGYDIKSLKFKEAYYDNLAWAMYNQKDYKSYDYLSLAFDLRDSIRDTEIRTILSEIEAKHNVDIVRRDELNKQIEANTRTWIVGGLGGLISFSLLYFVFFYRLRQKNLKLTMHKNQLLQEQNIEKLKLESREKILEATLDGKETERKEIAEVLHDNISALLSSANLHLQASKGRFKEGLPPELQKAQDIILSASSQIRNLSHTLISSVLLKFGLAYAVRDMAKKYSNINLSFTSNSTDIRRYHQYYEIKVYNIIQELANNIIKHSNASEAVINLSQVENMLVLDVIDNGTGFDISNIKQKGGIGLNQIEARVKMMKGVMKISSTKSSGTKIKIELPIVYV